MQYMLLIHRDDEMVAKMTPSERQSMTAAYGAYTQAMLEAGVLLKGDRLHAAADAAIVRVKNGKTAIVNGPYAEAKEQLGGYYMIEAKDLDAAIGWAARCPGAQDGAIEVRPIWAI